MTALEFNFDALVGPTHNYAGLAKGNLASQENRRLVSHPRWAALQGLEKMKFVADLGVPQCVLPPQMRPDMTALRRLGRFAAPRKDFHIPRLIFLLGIQEARRRIHFHECNPLWNGERYDRQRFDGLFHEVDPDRECRMRS